jgi:hypothetical protein
MFALALSVEATVTRADIVQGPVLNPANNHSYYLLSQDTWTNSETQAEALGGTLVTVNDAAENSYVYNTFAGAGTRNLWIGYNDPTQDSHGGLHASNFTWVSGETAAYTDWCVGEPNNSGRSGEHEYYGMMWGLNSDIALDTTHHRVAGGWNDIVTAGTYPVIVLGQPYGVVEIVPEPASISLLVLGTVSMLIRRRRCR